MEQKPPGEESKTDMLEKSNKSKDVSKPEKEAVCRKVSHIGSECMSTMIIPVWVSPKSSPITCSRNVIPTDRSHIPTPAIAEKWPHLRRIAHLVHPMQDCEVGLLIGCNCPLDLVLRSYIRGEGKEGWSIVGGTDPYEDGDAIGITHITVVKEIQDQLIPRTDQEAHRQEDRLIAMTTVKEVMDIRPTEITRILESDFTDGSEEDNAVAGGHAVPGENWKWHPSTGGWALQDTTKPTKQQKGSTEPVQSSQTTVLIRREIFPSLQIVHGRAHRAW